MAKTKTDTFTADMLAFVLQAIIVLRDTSKSIGVHTSYTGLSDAFLAQFGVRLYESERDAAGKFLRLAGPLAGMIAAGKIVTKPVTGGLMVYEPTEYASVKAQATERAAGERLAKGKTLAARILAGK
jgi:hypothetical protein